MNKYIRKPVGEVADIRRGASPRPIDDWMSPTGIPWVKISDATRTDSRFISKTEGFIREEGKSKSVEVFPEDLIISNSATPGLPKIMKIHACIHDGWLLAENFKGVTRDYLFYQVKFLRKYLVNQGNGSIFTNLKTDILKEFPIAIPVDEYGVIDIDKQKRIAEVLTKIEDKIENNYSINSELEAIAKTIYDYWFLQFEFPDENGKPYKSSGGKMVWNEELKRDIPDGWEPKKLDSVLEISTDKIKLENIGNRVYAPIEVIPRKRMSFYETADMEKAATGLCPFEKKAILLSNRRVYFHKVSIAPFAGVTRDTVIIITPKNKSNLGYVYQLVNSNHFIKYATKNSYGSEQPVLSPVAVLDYQFAHPNTDLYIKYSKTVESLIDKVLANELENRELASLRDFLLPLLMNGQVSFKEDT